MNDFIERLITKFRGNFSLPKLNKKNSIMSKRFYAACAAMQGLSSNFDKLIQIHKDRSDVTDMLVSLAYELADKLIEEENAK